MYTAVSWAGSEKKPKSYFLREYFPLKPGLRWVYQDQDGNERISEIKIPVKSKLKEGMILMPFEDYLHDVRFVRLQAAGLVMPQRYWSVSGFCQADSDQDRPTVLLPSILKPGRFGISRSHTLSRRWPSMSEMAYSDLELVYSNVPMGVEDVTTPAGVFKDCIKISLANTARAYAVGFDAIRVGYIWLAPQVGIVKEDLVNMYNYTDPKAVHSIFDVRQWELAQFTTMIPVPVLSYQEAREAPAAPARPSRARAVAVKKTVEAEGMIWQNNSRIMYEKALEKTPFLIRPLAKKKIMESIRQHAGERKTVSEEAVIAGVKDSAPERIAGGVIAELEKLRTQ
jgi:hypothetical protein